MADAIDGFSGNGATSVETSRGTQQAARESAVAVPVNTPPVAGEQVSITGAAVWLAVIGQKLSASPVIDAARVARIAQSLEDGTYTISARNIASGLLQSDQALAKIGLQNAYQLSSRV